MAPVHAQAVVHLHGEVIASLDPKRSDPLVVGDRVVQQVGSVDALRGLQPDAIIVATPTGDHAASVKYLASELPGVRLIVEKPVATTPLDYRSAMDAADTAGCPVTVLLHAAHAPEVGWAAENLASWAEIHGGIRKVTSRFCDPYGAPEMRDRRRSLVSSWIDSGINLLSVLDRLLTIEAIAPGNSELPYEHVAKGIGRCGGPEPFPVVMLTSWRVLEPSKSTVLDFHDGTQLILDHQAVAGWRLEPGRSLDRFYLDAAGPRLRVHYERMFDDEAAAGWRPHRGVDDRLHDMLFAGNG